MPPWMNCRRPPSMPTADNQGAKGKTAESYANSSLSFLRGCRGPSIRARGAPGGAFPISRGLYSNPRRAHGIQRVSDDELRRRRSRRHARPAPESILMTQEPMDPRTLVSLLSSERALLVRLARRRLPTDADAEDVVQRAMMRAAEGAGSLEDPARVRAWFARILHRAIADFYRSRPPEDPTESMHDVAVSTPDLPGRPCACSMRLLDVLRPSYADVIRRIDVEGQSSESVAKALAISSSNLHVRLHRARQALRERLQEHCGVSSCGPCLDCSCDAHARCGARALAAG